MEALLRFIADEGVEKDIVLALRKKYNVLYVAESMQSSADDQILRKAGEENRILITLDKDFGELVYRLNQVHAGVILCRVQSLPIGEAVMLVTETVEKYGSDLRGAFTVIQPKNIRIRRK
jgi:predicted nuclease of predicted toxin-antitoxin system